MKINIQMEMIFAVGIILFTISILIYGAILKRLLGLVGRKGIWIFPVIGGILLLLGAGIHFYRIFFYSDALSHADPADLFPLIVGMLQHSTYEAGAIFLAGLLALLGSGIYYRWITR